MRRQMLLGSIVLITLLVLLTVFYSRFFLILLAFLSPFFTMIFIDSFQVEHTIKRNFPLIGRTRYIAEWMRPKLYQYFVESETEGRPISRMFRSIVYQRAKQELDTSPFGTLFNVYEKGHEWMSHSIAALDPHKLNQDPRITIGGPACKKPYSCSLLNISAMSFGSLSKNAILALNGGAKLGGFAHNSGEGGISSHHLKEGGDLIYQIGTGYFGSRNEHGGFSETNFVKLATDERVKMIELKVSQGAKPGHGGILPARKLTQEIAAIRNVPMGIDVISPPYHKEFSTPIQMLEFLNRLRELSGWKPTGFKLCIGQKSEFLAICKAMVKTGIKPDFISVDGSEGGTGAAPLEFANSVGTPFREGLAFVLNALIGFDLKKDIKILASGKILTGFHIYRALALGADVCYSARGMMLALGCIQALECNKNTCPTGIATQDSSLINGLVVSDKKQRVANFQKETINSFLELMAAAGISQLHHIDRSQVFRRIEMNMSQRYDEIYPYITRGCLLEKRNIPEGWQAIMSMARANSFEARYVEALEG